MGVFLFVCVQIKRAIRLHLGDPDEDFQLVDVELLIHAFSEPGPQQVHGGSVPLLKHIRTAPSSKTHTRTHTQDHRDVRLTFKTPTRQT